MKKKILLINRSAPYGTPRAQEALDVLLMASTFEQELSVLFMGDGVLQLKAGQNPQLLGLKNFSAAFKAFPLYDIQQVYVDEQALAERGLAADELLLKATLLNSQAISALMAQQDSIFNF